MKLRLVLAAVAMASIACVDARATETTDASVACSVEGSYYSLTVWAEPGAELAVWGMTATGTYEPVSTASLDSSGVVALPLPLPELSGEEAPYIVNIVDANGDAFCVIQDPEFDWSWQ